MEPKQISNMQALFRQHMEALELALSVGKQYEQTLASLAIQQASSSQPVGHQMYPPKESEAEMKMRDDQGRHKRCADLRHPLLEHTSDGSKLRRSSFSATELEVISSRDEARLASQLKTQSGNEQREQSSPIAKKEAMFRDTALKRTGCAQRLHKSIIFNSICFAVVLVNAIWVTIDFENIEVDKKLNIGFHIIGCLICGWYSFEILVWFCAFQHKHKVLNDKWLLTDAVIVVSMVWGVAVGPLVEQHLEPSPPSWLRISFRVRFLSFLSVFRLARLGRFAGLLHPYSRGMLFYATIVAKGVKETIGLVFWFGLTSLGFAFAFRMLEKFKDSNVPEFESLFKAFNYLFWSAFASVDKNFIDKMFEEGWMEWALIVVFTLIGNLTVTKILTGVLFQVVMKLIQQDKEKNKTADLEQAVREMSERLDSTGSGCVSREEFENLMSNPDLIKSLNSGGVDVAGFVQFTRAYFPKDDELTVDDLVRWAKQFCGFKPASVKDMMNLRRLIYLEINVVRSGQDQIFGEMQVVQGQILQEMHALNEIVDEWQAYKNNQGWLPF